MPAHGSAAGVVPSAGAAAGSAAFSSVAGVVLVGVVSAFFFEQPATERAATNDRTNSFFMVSSLVC